MARRRGRRGGRRSNKIPILTLAALAIPAVDAINRFGFSANALNTYQAAYTGFDVNTGQFFAPHLVRGWGPLLALGLMKKIVLPIAGRPRLRMLPFSLS